MMVSDESGTGTEPVEQGSGWRRAAALVVLLVLTSLVPAGMLVSVPLLILIALGGMRSGALLVTTVVAMFLTLAGQRDPLWFAERGWAVMVGGYFAAVTLLAPGWRLTSRALAAVGASAATGGVFYALRAGAWANLDWSVRDRLAGVLGNFLAALELVREGQSVSPAFIAAIYRTVEFQAAVFPAVVALESMAALGVAWWLYRRLVFRDEGLAPVRSFGFNDHLVWFLIAGLLLLVTNVSEGSVRLGANLAVFMTALYAARGAGVVVFVNGGLSLLGVLMFILGVFFAAPIIVGFAALLGVADTWLDLRARAEAIAG